MFVKNAKLAVPCKICKMCCANLSSFLGNTQEVPFCIQCETRPSNVKHDNADSSGKRIKRGGAEKLRNFPNHKCYGYALRSRSLRIFHSVTHWFFFPFANELCALGLIRVRNPRPVGASPLSGPLIMWKQTCWTFSRQACVNSRSSVMRNLFAESIDGSLGDGWSMLKPPTRKLRGNPSVKACKVKQR